MTRGRRGRMGHHFPSGSSATWRRQNHGLNPGKGRDWITGGGKAGSHKRRRGRVRVLTLVTDQVAPFQTASSVRFLTRKVTVRGLLRKVGR